jgi:hypothetical protein
VIDSALYLPEPDLESGTVYRPRFSTPIGLPPPTGVSRHLPEPDKEGAEASYKGKIKDLAEYIYKEVVLHAASLSLEISRMVLSRYSL